MKLDIIFDRVFPPTHRIEHSHIDSRNYKNPHIMHTSLQFPPTCHNKNIKNNKVNKIKVNLIGICRLIHHNHIKLVMCYLYIHKNTTKNKIDILEPFIIQTNHLSLSLSNNCTILHCTECEEHVVLT